PVTMSAPASPCRSDDGVAVTLTPSSAGATSTANTNTAAITTPTRIAMPRLYAAEGERRRNDKRECAKWAWAGSRPERIRRAVARPEAQGASAARVVPAAGGAASATPVSGDGGQAEAPERGGARGEEVERTTAPCPRAPPSRNAKAKIRSENLGASRRRGDCVQSFADDAG